MGRIAKPEVYDSADRSSWTLEQTRANMDHIFDIQLKRVGKLLAARQLQIAVSPEARTALCDAGFDPTFGARPLKRAIQQYLLNPMSKAIVGSGYEPGDTVRVTLEGEEITFQREAAPAPA